MNTPTSVRLPDTLERRVRARAYLERRSFSDSLRVLLERGLEARPAHDEIDAAEVERLALVAETALAEYRG